MKEILLNIGEFWYMTTDRALFRIEPKRWYCLPACVRMICQALNIRPNNEPITREQEIMWDYQAAKNNHK